MGPGPYTCTTFLDTGSGLLSDLSATPKASRSKEKHSRKFESFSNLFPLRAHESAHDDHARSCGVRIWAVAQSHVSIMIFLDRIRPFTCQIDISTFFIQNAWARCHSSHVRKMKSSKYAQIITCKYQLMMIPTLTITQGSN